MDVLRQDFGNPAYDVAAQQRGQPATARRAQEQMGRAHRGRDVHDGFRRRVADSVTRQNRMPARFLKGMRKNTAGIVIVLTGAA